MFDPLEIIQNMKTILNPKDKGIEAKVAEKFDPNEFYKQRPGLYPWSSFMERVLPKAECVEQGKSFIADSFDLKKDSTDAAIEAALSEKHIFSETDACALIAELIKKQPNGEEGALLNNGYVNLFYTEAFVVGVYWYAGFGEWYVLAWFRGAYAWSADSRVFSPATDRS